MAFLNCYGQILDRIVPKLGHDCIYYLCLILGATSLHTDQSLKQNCLQEG